jgi:hypothetical protein
MSIPRLGYDTLEDAAVAFNVASLQRAVTKRSSPPVSNRYGGVQEHVCRTQVS